MELRRQSVTSCRFWATVQGFQLSKLSTSSIRCVARLLPCFKELLIIDNRFSIGEAAWCVTSDTGIGRGVPCAVRLRQTRGTSALVSHSQVVPFGGEPPRFRENLWHLAFHAFDTRSFHRRMFAWARSNSMASPLLRARALRTVSSFSPVEGRRSRLSGTRRSNSSSASILALATTCASTSS